MTGDTKSLRRLMGMDVGDAVTFLRAGIHKVWLYLSNFKTFFSGPAIVYRVEEYIFFPNNV
jgi:hypothetical protein